MNVELMILLAVYVISIPFAVFMTILWWLMTHQFRRDSLRRIALLPVIFACSLLPLVNTAMAVLFADLMYTRWKQDRLLGRPTKIQ